MSPAEKHYNALKKAQREYYYRNKDRLLERMARSYREKNPNPRPRGRPRKNGDTLPPSEESADLV